MAVVSTMVVQAELPHSARTVPTTTVVTAPATRVVTMPATTVSTAPAVLTEVVPVRATVPVAAVVRRSVQRGGAGTNGSAGSQCHRQL
jgi:hypothetical protein